MPSNSQTSQHALSRPTDARRRPFPTFPIPTHYHTVKRAKNAAFAPCVKFSYQETISRDCFIRKTLYAREKRVFSGYVGMRLWKPWYTGIFAYPLNKLTWVCCGYAGYELKNKHLKAPHTHIPTGYPVNLCMWVCTFYNINIKIKCKFPHTH